MILLSVNAEELDKYGEFAFKYGSIMSQIYLHPAIFFILVSILIATYVVIYFLFTRESKQIAIEKGVWKQFKIYIFAHMLLQMLLNFFLSYFIIKFANAMWENYIINWIIAPIFGLVLALIFDRAVIMKLENKSNNFINPIKEFTVAKNHNKNESTNESNVNNITINVGGNNNISESKEEKIKQEEDVELMDINIKETSDDIIRSLVDIQKKQNEQLNILSNSVDAIRHSIINDKKIILKKEMYECINKGFVTPEEDEKIRIEYQSYIGLGGNGEIKALYDERFIKLSVHC